MLASDLDGLTVERIGPPSMCPSFGLLPTPSEPGRNAATDSLCAFDRCDVCRRFHYCPDTFPPNSPGGLLSETASGPGRSPPGVLPRSVPLSPESSSATPPPTQKGPAS